MAFRYRPECPIQILRKNDVWKFREYIHGFKGIVVPDNKHHRPFWWLANDVNFCVVSSAGPKPASWPQMDIKKLFKIFLDTNPVPPATIYIVKHPQPPQRLNCDGCGRHAYCARQFRKDTVFRNMCCVCLYIPLLWVDRSVAYNFPGYQHICRHTGIYGKKELYAKERKDALAKDETIREPKWEEDLENICPICHGPLQAPVSIECGHKYCLRCIHQWVYQADKTAPDCPVCRHNLTFNTDVETVL